MEPVDGLKITEVMMMSIEALKKLVAAVEAIPEDVEGWLHDSLTDALIDARRAIAEAEKQEQGEQDKFCDNNCAWTDHHPDCKLATPQQRKPLTDAEMWKLVNDCTIGGDLHADKLVREVEAAHGIKEKNT